MVTPSAGHDDRQQILDGMADFHELSEPGRLGDELRDPEVFEQRFIAAGSGRPIRNSLRVASSEMT